MLSLRLFGGASLAGEDGPLTGHATQRHRLALLALLATSYPRAQSRDKLIACLWPERDTAHARNLLNQAVHALRRALGEETILSAGDELRFEAGVIDADVVAFEEALAMQDLERAVGLYRGPFLDGFFLGDAPEFEQWVEGQRARLAGGYARALEALAAAAEERGDAPGAAEWWKLRAAHDPYDSRVAQRLMQALEASGNRAGALQHATLHERLLREELEMEPDPEIAVLAERMRAGATPPSTPIVRPPARSPAALGAIEPGPGVSDDGQEVTRVDEQPVRVQDPASAGADGSWGRVAAAVAVLLALVVAGWMSVNGFGRKPAEIKRIAVLPLANLTGDPQQDYFVAGMHDALVAELAQVEALVVYSRQSVLRYQGSELPLPAIARELGVDALVEGSVFRSGDSVRITVQLVRAEPEEHLWAASHHGPLSHALALQGEVARAIAGAIRARVEPEVETRLSHGRAVHPEAQQAYLRGLYHLERGSYGELLSAADRLEEHRTAIRHLEEATALDPGWAAAHAKLALAYHWVASDFGGEHEAEFYPKAKAAALQALALDETESQAYASLGFVLYRYDWDWAAAEQAIRRALELDPNSHHWIAALYLQAAGRHDEAIARYHMAEERNPLSDMLKTQVAFAYACADRYDEAIARIEELHGRMDGALRSRLSGDAAGTVLSGFRERLYSQQGRHDEAIRLAEETVALSDSLPAAAMNLALLYARAGRVAESRRLINRMEERARADGWVWRPAHLYAALGETERALDMVEEGLAVQRGALPNFRCSLTYKLLRDEPRMQALLAPVRFPH